MPGLKLPCRALFLAFGRTFFYSPTGFLLTGVVSLSGDQEKDLSLHMTWHLSPPLLVAMYSLNGCAEQFGHLFLGLVECLTGLCEFFAVHRCLRKGRVLCFEEGTLDFGYHNVVHVSTKNDGFVKSPSAVLCFIFRHCDVRKVRLIPQSSHALHMNFLRSRQK